MTARCAWAGTEPPMLAYHDEEWGVPVHDDGRLFEFLVLEGAQAGLSWQTILNKRDGYRRAFAGFDVDAVAAYTTDEIEALLLDPAIVRNRLKVAGAVRNARAVRAVQAEQGSFAAYIWGFVDGQPQVNGYRRLEEVPAETETSRAMSRDLKKRGFTFVGPTICYAFMQATGMVNDHETGCFRHRQLGG